MIATGIDLGEEFAVAQVGHGPQGYFLTVLAEKNSVRDPAGCLALLQAMPTPDILACEDLFFSEQKPRAMRAERMVGVIDVAIQFRGWPKLVRLAPTEVKESATGYGLAPKEGVRKIMIARFPTFEDGTAVNWPKRTLNASDAVAIAYAALLKKEARFGQPALNFGRARRKGGKDEALENETFPAGLVGGGGAGSFSPQGARPGGARAL